MVIKVLRAPDDTYFVPKKDGPGNAVRPARPSVFKAPECPESPTGQHQWGPTVTSPTGVVCRDCGVVVDDNVAPVGKSPLQTAQGRCAADGHEWYVNNVYENALEMECRRCGKTDTVWRQDGAPLVPNATVRAPTLPGSRQYQGREQTTTCPSNNGGAHWWELLGTDEGNRIRTFECRLCKQFEKRPF